jgi:hypothetical protein
MSFADSITSLLLCFWVGSLVFSYISLPLTVSLRGIATTLFAGLLGSGFSHSLCLSMHELTVKKSVSSWCLRSISLWDYVGFGSFPMFVMTFATAIGGVVVVYGLLS